MQILSMYSKNSKASSGDEAGLLHKLKVFPM